MGLKQHKRHSAAVCGSKRWQGLRQLAKRRDGFQCVQCSGVGHLEVDHILPVRTHPELSFDLGNLQTLCRQCHSRKTRIEVGLNEVDPKRQAWRNLVREIANPRKEPLCSNP